MAGEFNIDLTGTTRPLVVAAEVVGLTTDDDLLALGDSVGWQVRLTNPLSGQGVQVGNFQATLSGLDAALVDISFSLSSVSLGAGGQGFVIVTATANADLPADVPFTIAVTGDIL